MNIEKEKKFSRCTVGQTVILEEWIKKNWSALVQERFTLKDIAERAQRDLKFTLNETLIRSHIKQTGRELPSVVRVLRDHKVDRVAALAFLLKKVLQRLNDLEQDLNGKTTPILSAREAAVLTAICERKFDHKIRNIADQALTSKEDSNAKND